jgi:hypothetical protein
MKRGGWLGFERVAVAAVVVAAAISVGPALAQANGDCLSVDIHGTVVLPDGSERPATLLTICVHERMSPVSVLHRVYIERSIVGLYVSRTHRSEAFDGTDPLVLLEADTSERHRLIGYVWPARSRASAHLLSAPERRLDGGAVIASAGTPPPPGPRAEWVLARAK